MKRATARGLSRRSILAGAAGAFGTVGILRRPLGAAQFEFKSGTSLAPDHPMNTRQQQMWDAIEKESNGRIHTQLFPNSQLGDDAAMLTQLRVGALPFYSNNAGVFAAVSPVADITNIGFAFKDEADASRVCDGPLGSYIREETETKGIHFLRTIWNSGMLVIGTTTKPIRTPADLAGQKLRVPTSRVYVDVFKQLGASPTPLSAGDVYTALQTHLIDGEMASITTIATAHWTEVNKYISLANVAWSGNWLGMNGALWKSLPPDLQDIVERNNTKYALIERRESIAHNAALASSLDRGNLSVISGIDPAPFQARLGPYYAAWAKTFGPKAWSLLESAIGHKLG